MTAIFQSGTEKLGKTGMYDGEIIIKCLLTYISYRNLPYFCRDSCSHHISPYNCSSRHHVVPWGNRILSTLDSSSWAYRIFPWWRYDLLQPDHLRAQDRPGNIIISVYLTLSGFCDYSISPPSWSDTVNSRKGISLLSRVGNKFLNFSSWMGWGLRISFTRVFSTSASAVGHPGTKAWRWRWNSENSLNHIR